MTIIYDINPEYNLALIKEKDKKHRYAPLDVVGTDSKVKQDSGVYLIQRHYVARCHTSGLFISHVDPILPGWQQLERYIAWREQHYGYAKR